MIVVMEGTWGTIYRIDTVRVISRTWMWKWHLLHRFCIENKVVKCLTPMAYNGRMEIEHDDLDVKFMDAIATVSEVIPDNKFKYYKKWMNMFYYGKSRKEVLDQVLFDKEMLVVEGALCK